MQRMSRLEKKEKEAGLLWPPNLFLRHSNSSCTLYLTMYVSSALSFLLRPPLHCSTWLDSCIRLCLDYSRPGDASLVLYKDLSWEQQLDGDWSPFFLVILYLEFTLSFLVPWKLCKEKKLMRPSRVNQLGNSAKLWRYFYIYSVRREREGENKSFCVVIPFLGGLWTFFLIG